LLRRRQRIEVVDYPIGFRAITLVFADDLEQISGASVMQEKHPLPESPQGSGSKLVWPGIPLRDAVPQPVSHVVQQQVRKQICLHTTQARSVDCEGRSACRH
jgi:hypothetical protein